jgi:hypothetical protein
MSDESASDRATAMLKALRALGKLPPERPFATSGLTLTLAPREEGLADKGIPVEQIFHKLTMMRDKLRVMEQRINASDALSLDERAKLQHDLTSVYDAFATLAAFFSDDALPAPPVDAPSEGGA